MKLFKNWNNELFEAIQVGDLLLVNKALSEGANVSRKNKYGFTPLLYAAHNKDCKKEIVQVLIDNGVNKDECRKKDGCTALHYATMNNNSELVQLFMELKANVNVSEKIEGKTPLHFAIEKGYNEIALIFIKSKPKANPNAKDNEGNTPLHYAMKIGNNEVSLALIVADADLEAKNNSGKTPYDIESEKHELEGMVIHLKKEGDTNNSTEIINTRKKLFRRKVRTRFTL